MTDENECFDSSEMDREQLIEMLEGYHLETHALGQEKHSLLSNVGVLIAAMEDIASGLAIGSGLGKRKRAIADAIGKLVVIAAMARASMPTSEGAMQDVIVDAQFEDIVRGLDEQAEE